MLLTDEQQAMLAGNLGRGVQKAMEIVVALGKIYDAKQLLPISGAHIIGVSYKYLGDAGFEFLKELADDGVQVCVPTTLNPAGIDLKKWREMGVSEAYARKQRAVVDMYSKMGIRPTCTCTPYLVGNEPKSGEHVAWCESSALIYANSILGASTNREGGPSALAAAITGHTAAYGFHLEENRAPTHIVDVKCSLNTESDFGALGYLVGKIVQTGIPYFRLAQARIPKLEDFKVLGAAMAASGAVALYYWEGSTSAPKKGLKNTLKTIIIDHLTEGYAALNKDVAQVDLVVIGCPHTSLAEIEMVADYLTGKHVSIRLWVMTARKTMAAAQTRGLVSTIQQAGGKVFADSCPFVSPVKSMGITSLATNSAKAAYYSQSLLGIPSRFGSFERCLEAAVRGHFR